MRSEGGLGADGERGERLKKGEKPRLLGSGEVSEAASDGCGAAAVAAQVQHAFVMKLCRSTICCAVIVLGSDTSIRMLKPRTMHGCLD